MLLFFALYTKNESAHKNEMTETDSDLLTKDGFLNNG